MGTETGTESVLAANEAVREEAAKGEAVRPAQAPVVRPSPE
jgi:hypothetical protein